MHYIDQLPNTLNLGGLISIKQNEGERNARHLSPLSLPEEPRAREEAIDEVLMDRILGYLSTHTFEFKVPGDTIQEFKRSFEEQGERNTLVEFPRRQS